MRSVGLLDEQRFFIKKTESKASRLIQWLGYYRLLVACICVSFVLVGLLLWWQLRDRHLVQTFRSTEGSVALAISPDAQVLATSGDSGTITIWQRHPFQERVLALPTQTGPSALAFCPDAHTLFSGGGDGVVRQWDVATGQEQRTFQVVQPELKRGDLRLHADPVDRMRGILRLVCSPDGQWLGVGGVNGQIVVLQRATGALVQQQQRHPVTVQAYADIPTLAFSPDGRYLASGGSIQGSVEILDTHTGMSDVVHYRGFNSVDALQFSPDGQTLFIVNGSANIHMYAVATGQVTWEGHIQAFNIPSSAIHPQQPILARAGHSLAGYFTGGLPLIGQPDTSIYLERLNPLERIITLKGHRGLVTALALSADGQWLTSGSVDRTVRLWHIAD